MVNISSSNRTSISLLFLLFVLSLFTFCGKPSNNSPSPGLTGAWKAKLQFQTGAFAAIKDLEFMYVFNAGGTMTESSNYDSLPPVPPAYGIWKNLGGNQYEVNYEFYLTRNPTPEESKSISTGWFPSGHGVFKEKITLSQDGNSFYIHYSIRLL